MALTAPLGAADYYVDSINGSDDNDGICPDTPWARVAMVSKSEFEPGDVIHLRSGCTFTGQLILSSSGKEGKPIRVTRYDEGPKPHIKCDGKFQVAVLLENVSHVIVDGLEVTNTGPKPEAKRRGVLVRIRNMGVARSIVLRDLFVHDVNGSISKSEGGGTGIRWEVDSRKKKTRIDGLLIEDCHVLRCDRDAIKGWMDPWDDLGFLSTNVVIRNNLLEDIGGDGIVPIGTDRAVIEYNRLYGFRQRFDPTIPEVSNHAGPSVGIWPWSSKNTQIRYNEVWGYHGTFDGQGFDSDYNCSGTTFEYNLSADNAGGFFLICNWAKHVESGQSIGNSDTLIRHNISFNDHVRSFVLNGPVETVRIQENIIYNTIEEELPVIMDTPWGRYSDSVEVTGNLFFTTGTARIFQGTWAGDGLGNWKYQGPINRKTFTFKENAYSKVADHEEEGMQQLDPDSKLGALIEQLQKDEASTEGFAKMVGFLKGSRYWEQLQQAM
jgi:hypothetical protein